MPATPNGVVRRLLTGLRAALLEVTGVPEQRVFGAESEADAFDLGKARSAAGLAIAILPPQDEQRREFGSGPGKPSAYRYALPVLLLIRKTGAVEIPSVDLWNAWEQIVAGNTGVCAYTGGGDKPSIGDSLTGDIPIYYSGPAREIAPKKPGDPTGLLLIFRTSAEVTL